MGLNYIKKKHRSKVTTTKVARDFHHRCYTKINCHPYNRKKNCA